MAVMVSDKLGNPIYNRSAHCTKVSDIGPWAYSLFIYVWIDDNEASSKNANVNINF